MATLNEDVGKSLLDLKEQYTDEMRGTRDVLQDRVEDVVRVQNSEARKRIEMEREVGCCGLHRTRKGVSVEGNVKELPQDDLGPFTAALKNH